MIDFIMSEEGFKLIYDFGQKFNCTIRIDEPSSFNLTVDINDRSYLIPSDLSVDRFKKIIGESVKTGKNLLFDVVKNSEIKYDSNVLY